MNYEPAFVLAAVYLVLRHFGVRMSEKVHYTCHALHGGSWHCPDLQADKPQLGGRLEAVTDYFCTRTLVYIWLTSVIVLDAGA